MGALTERLRRLLRDDAAEDMLLDELLSQAELLILNYTGQPALPDRLIPVQLQLALIAYNRLGMEGESWRHEGGLDARRGPARACSASCGPQAAGCAHDPPICRLTGR